MGRRSSAAELVWWSWTSRETFPARIIGRGWGMAHVPKVTSRQKSGRAYKWGRWDSEAKTSSEDRDLRRVPCQFKSARKDAVSMKTQPLGGIPKASKEVNNSAATVKKIPPFTRNASALGFFLRRIGRAAAIEAYT